MLKHSGEDTISNYLGEGYLVLDFAWELCKNMKAGDVQNILDKALAITGLTIDQRPRLLSDNGSCYISGDLKEYLQNEENKQNN